MPLRADRRRIRRMAQAQQAALAIEYTGLGARATEVQAEIGGRV